MSLGLCALHHYTYRLLCELHKHSTLLSISKERGNRHPFLREVFDDLVDSDACPLFALVGRLRIVLRNELQRSQPFQRATLPCVPHWALVAVEAMIARWQFEIPRRDMM